MVFVKNIEIKPEESHEYGIKLWIDINAGNEIQGKTFSARVVVDSIQELADNYEVNTRPILYPAKDQNGNIDMILDINEAYQELGVEKIEDDQEIFTSKDVVTTYEYENPETKELVPVKEINTSQKGIYYVTYQVTDSDGNIGKAVRVVAIGKEHLVIYNSVESVVKAFPESELKEAIMCSYVEGNEDLFFDCKIHETTEEALNSRTNGAIILTKNIDNKTINIQQNQNILLELNGHNITNAKNNVSIVANGNVKISDYTRKGTIYYGPVQAMSFGSQSKVEIDYVKIEQLETTEEIITRAAIWIASSCNGCNLIINDADIQSNTSVIGQNGETQNTKITINDGHYLSKENTFPTLSNTEITINGGDFESQENSVIYSTVNAVTIINGGYLKSQNNYTIFFINGTLTINGKEAQFDEEGNYISGTYIYGNGPDHATIMQLNGKLVVNGGNIFHDNNTSSGATWRQHALRMDDSGNGNTVAILNGGVFSSGLERKDQIIYLNEGGSVIKVNGATIQGLLNIPRDFTNSKIPNYGYICKGQIDGIYVLEDSKVFIKSSGITWKTPPTLGKYIVEDDSITCEE